LQTPLRKRCVRRGSSGGLSRVHGVDRWGAPEARLRAQRRREGELVFCHPQKGKPLDVDTYRAAFAAALTAAGITEHVRPFHDLRHASLTNGAAVGETPIALMTRAGHANMSTTQTYLRLARRGLPRRSEAPRGAVRLPEARSWYRTWYRFRRPVFDLQGEPAHLSPGRGDPDAGLSRSGCGSGLSAKIMRGPRLGKPP
jgi:integrase